MNTWTYFFWLLRQASDGPLVMWPVTAILLLWLGFAGWKHFISPGRTRPRGGWFLQIAPACIPATLLVFGAAFQCEHCTPPEWQDRVQHLWAIDVINALTIVQIASSVVIVWIASGTRSLSAAIQTLFLWCSFWTGFISAMSISGDWL